MNPLDPTSPMAANMRNTMSIMAALGPKQTPNVNDPPIMGAGNPMATAPVNPAGFAGPNNPMQNNPILQLISQGLLR